MAKAKYTYLRLKKANYRLWDARDCDGQSCPNCGQTNITFRFVGVQLGLWAHKVTSFAVCANCKKRFAWHEESKMAASKLLKAIETIYVKEVV